MVSEDPFLSGHCDASFGIGCSMVNLAIGLVISGIIGFIVGILIGISDLKKEKKLQK
jgi:ABC-type nitrate/sulfonate/bicarbonate transport system permease component